MSTGHTDARPAERQRRLEAALEEAGVVSGTDLDAMLDRYLATASPANGARLIARAWVDPGFRERLLADANAAIGELGLSMGGGVQPQVLRVVENTARVHNVVVCTLCSCYPLALLGPSPSWYRSEAYRSRVVRRPREVLAEFGLVVEDSVELRVWDASAETRYLVLPRRPAGTGDLDEEALAALVTRRGMIGTAAV
ncbi:MAG TPA: nitrile hydratase subunit alpha [Acidimicrobiales bacterium]|nr:nitrile hydratase subunit alpha [Acidimicrobiales bacterium]